MLSNSLPNISWYVMQEKLKRDINSGILVETIREEKLEHEAISLEMLREKDASGGSQR